MKHLQNRIVYFHAASVNKFMCPPSEEYCTMCFQYLVVLVYVVCVIGYLCSEGEHTGNKTEIHLLGLFPVTGGWDRGKAILPAAQRAIVDINHRSDILPGYILKMVYNDTQCDAGLGIKALADNICQSPTKMMIIGAGCSTVSQAVAQAAHHWNLIQISYVSVSPALSDKSIYPYFFRIVASETVLNDARVALMNHFEWKKIATLHQDYQIFSTMIEDLIKRQDADFEILAQVVFNDNPETAIERLKEADARIIIAGFYPDKARKVFCAAYNMGFYGRQVWITTSATSNAEWWEDEYGVNDDASINCTSEQLKEAAKGTLMFYNIWSNLNETDDGLTGMSVKKFRTLFPEKKSGYHRAPTGYDAVWTAAIALNRTMNKLKESGSNKTLADFTYEDKAMTELMKTKLLEVNFTSVSGQVAFNKDGDGIRLVGIQMVQDSGLSRVGKYDKMKFGKERLQMDDIWNGKVPRDSMRTEKVIESIPIYIYVIVVSLNSLGVILAVVFLAFNIVYRNVKIIRISSPNINNIILLGCILAYLSIYVEDITNTRNTAYCQVRISLLLLAFSLSFGALFAKTWRIHSIFTASLQMKRRSIQDHTLFIMIGVLVGLNSVVLCIWFLSDPPSLVSRDLPDKREEKDDTIIQYVHNYCWSGLQNYFLIAVMVVQGIFLLLGVFLAWETRKVKFSTLNESRYIGVCIYNVVALGVVGVLVSYSLSSSPSLVYVVISCIIILCTTVTQCLLFVPKILAYRRLIQGKLKETNMNTTCDQYITIQQRTVSTATQTPCTDTVDVSEHL